MLPHVRYDPAFLADYFPGPDRWPGAELQARTPGERTSGISNPPVLALAACRLAATGDEASLEFGERVCGPLCDWLSYLFRDRRLPASPLVAVVHPWETGWDNSPRWDLLPAAGLKPKRPYARRDTGAVSAAQRPGGRDYDGYVALAEIISEGGFELAAYRARTPFVVHDVVFDALSHRAAVELNGLCRRLGRPDAFAEPALAEFARGFEELHWNQRAQTYYDYDAQAGRQIEEPTAAALAALGGDLVPRNRAATLVERYLDRAGGLIPIPTVPPATAAFDADLYWRGPVWFCVNWLAADGLERLGLTREAAGLRGQTLDAFAATAFAEYLNPVTGAGRGIAGFSWTAALTLDWLANPL